MRKVMFMWISFSKKLRYGKFIFIISECIDQLSIFRIKCTNNRKVTLIKRCV